MGNGLKFHREGVPPVVRLRAERAGDFWEITVEDNGIGIEPEYAEKVFVIFQRLHGRDRYPGTGIGLALSKKIVEFHGGRIGLDPRGGPDSGAILRFTLPAVEETA
jgi:signal transduction histidine kinase